MHAGLRIVASFGALGVLLSATPGLAAHTVTLPGGAVVAVHLTSSLSSSTAKAGQTFGIVASRPTVVNGWVVVAQGAAGKGKVVAATPAGKSGRQGSMTIAFLWIYGADGSKIPLAAINRSNTGKNKTGSSNAANIAGTILLGPVGLFAHNFVKGKDVTIDPSHAFSAYVDHTVSVTAKAQYSGPR